MQMTPSRGPKQFNVFDVSGGDMGRAYRTLVLKYPLERLPPETAEKVTQLLKVQQEFRKWAEEWVRNNGRTPIPEQSPLKYFTREFLHAARALDWLVGVKENGTPSRLRLPLIFNAQLRLTNERDVSRGIFVDVPKREVRIRKWGGSTIALLLSKSAVKWILERVKEGAALAFAMAWVGRSHKNHATALYVALTFRRDVVQITPRRLLVVDFNALHNGVVLATVEENHVLRRGVLRPDIRRLIWLQRQFARLDALCAQREDDVVCHQANETKSRLWRLLRSWEDETARKIVEFAVRSEAAIIADVPDDESIRQLKEGSYDAEKKVFLNFGRLRRRIHKLAEWYGAPYREERLYSTFCPKCGVKMGEMPDRHVKCRCGFSAHRDEVPIHWAQKRFHELLKPPSFSAITLRIRVRIDTVA